MKLISTPHELEMVSGGKFFTGLQNMVFSFAGAGLGAKLGQTMLPPAYKKFGVLIGGAFGGWAGYTVSSMVQYFESSAYSWTDSTFNQKS